MTKEEQRTLLSMYFQRIKEILNDTDETYTVEERISDLEDYTFLLEILITS